MAPAQAGATSFLKPADAAAKPAPLAFGVPAAAANPAVLAEGPGLVAGSGKVDPAQML